MKEQVGTLNGAKADTAYFQQARKELGPGATLSAIAKRAQELKTAGKPAKDRRAGLHRALDCVLNRKAAKDAADFPAEYKDCKRCGKKTDVLEIFPGGVCLGCWEKKEGKAPLTEAGFKGMVNAFKNPLKKRG